MAPTTGRSTRTSRLAGLAIAAGSVLAACGNDRGTADEPTAPTAPTASSEPADHPTGHPGDAPTMSPSDRAAALVATAAFQDVDAATAAGYASTLDTLGCFEDPSAGGMGVHYLDDDLMDASVDAARPEALVYELDGDGTVVGLVAHEYIVPVEAWTAAAAPRLFGVDFHRHPSLPLWVLHTWIWKDNVAGVFADWNPAVRPCPDGVPVFGVDRPR